MNNQDKLFLKQAFMEKQAYGFLAKVPGFVAGLAGRRDLVGGLAAPIVKLFGGGQKLIGRGQQAVAAARTGLNKPMADVMASPLYQRGAKNVATGAGLRGQAGLTSAFTTPNPLSYRIGRGIGSVGIGAPLAMAPFTLSQYAGAASADPEIAKEYAMNMAEERLNDRLSQFGQLPFLERMQSAWNPQKFTEQMAQTAPEAADLMYAMQTGGANNPGLLRFLSSFNPFFSGFTGASDYARARVRSGMLDTLGYKSASEKQAMMGLLRGAIPGLKNMWQFGRLAGKSAPVSGVTLPRMSAAVNARMAQLPAWEALAQKGVYNFAKAPVANTFKGLGVATLPAFMSADYSAGQQGVYNQAAQDARALADMQFAETFNTPGFMGGLGRFGAALAPGLAQDLIMKSVRQRMYPELGA